MGGAVGWMVWGVGATPRVGGGGKRVDCALVSDLEADCVSVFDFVRVGRSSV